MLTDILMVILLSISPIFELRGAIPFGLIQGLNPLLVLIIAILGNIIVIPIVYFFLDYFHIYFMRIRLYRMFFREYIQKIRIRIENKIGTKYEFIALMLLVAIPLPFTGAYSGTLLSWFFGVDRKIAYKALITGVCIAGIIMMIFSLSAIGTYQSFVLNVSF